jgi:hypothetical protein
MKPDRTQLFCHSLATVVEVAFSPPFRVPMVHLTCQPLNQAGSGVKISPARGGGMARKRYTAAEIIGQMQTIDIEPDKGLAVVEACRKLGITEQTHYRWKKKYGGLRVDQAISTYQARILEKMNLKNNAELTRYGLNRGPVS